MSNIFVNTTQFDLNLLINEFTNEYIIDKGEKVEGLISSEIDKNQNARTLTPDLGAYEAK